MNIKQDLLVIVLIAFIIIPAQAYKLNPNEFADNGKFGYPIKLSTGDTAVYENNKTVEYIITFSLWNETGKSLFKYDPATDFMGAKYSYSIDKIEDLIRNNKLPIQEKWPIDAEHLKAALQNKEYPLKKKVTEDDSSSKKFRGVRLTGKIQDWKKAKDKSSGASISYVSDKNTDIRTVSGNGAIIFPYSELENTTAGYNGYSFIPSIEWNFKDIRNDDTTDDVEELKFSAGYSIYKTYNKNLRSIEYIVNPFVVTDLDFDGKIIGIESTANIHYQINNFSIGSYHKFSKHSNAAFKFDVVPKIQYSKVTNGSQFITRDDNDEAFLAGVDVELSLKPFGKKQNWEFVGGYSFLKSISGESETIEAKKFKVLYWFNKYIAFSGMFEDGETPLTNKDINQVTFGLEFEI